MSPRALTKQAPLPSIPAPVTDNVRTLPPSAVDAASGIKSDKRHSVDARDRSGNVASLLAAKSATGYLKAFDLLEQCATAEQIRDTAYSMQRDVAEAENFKKLMAQYEAIKTSCSKVPQQDIANRRTYLNRALALGEAAAAVSFLRAGPPGGLQGLSPSDPVHASWRAEAIEHLERFAISGSVDAAATLSHLALSREIPELRVDGRNWSYVLLYRYLDQRDAIASLPPGAAERRIKSTEEYVASIGKALSPEQKALGQRRFEVSLLSQLKGGKQ